MTNTPIFTMGYRQQEVNDLLAARQSNQIDYLIDVRSSPYSSYKPECSKNTLQTYLETKGIRFYTLRQDVWGDEKARPDRSQPRSARRGPGMQGKRFNGLEW